MVLKKEISDMNQEEKDREIKRLRRIIKQDYEILKKPLAPKLQVAHLERCIINYKKIFQYKKMDLSDKAGMGLMIMQYKTLCAVTRTKPIKFDDVEELQKV